MNEVETNVQEQKPKTSKLAVWSIVLGLIGFIAVFPLTLCGAPPFGLLIAIVGIYLGINALVEIRRRKRLLKVRILAVCGIFVCIMGQVLGMYSAAGLFFRGHRIAWQQMCNENLKYLSVVMQQYSNGHKGQYPAPNEWCDLIEDFESVKERSFQCPAVRSERCNYAINPNCQPNSPNDIVLLFETKESWNQFGGSELLTLENHNGKGCNILFNDGSVKFIKPEELSELKWDN